MNKSEPCPECGMVQWMEGTTIVTEMPAKRFDSGVECGTCKERSNERLREAGRQYRAKINAAAWEAITGEAK